MPRRALPSGNASFDCRARPGMTTIGGAFRAAVVCSRGPQNRSRSRAKRRPCSGCQTPRRPRTKSSAPSCACASISSGTAASAPTSKRPKRPTARSVTAATMACASTARSLRRASSARAAISACRSAAASNTRSRLSEYSQLMHSLERANELSRALEFLPNDEELAERRKKSLGLTRPELAVLLSYSKIWLSKHLLGYDVPADPYLSLELKRYFPGPVRTRYARVISRHRLRREIIAMATTNSLVNRMGPTFVARAQDDTGAAPARIARAYTAAREIFDMRDLWAQIEALDNRVSAKLQYGMMDGACSNLRHALDQLLHA